MTNSFSMSLVKGYGDCRTKIYEVEERLREVDSMKGDKIPDGI